MKNNGNGTHRLVSGNVRIEENKDTETRISGIWNTSRSE